MAGCTPRHWHLAKIGMALLGFAWSCGVDNAGLTVATGETNSAKGGDTSTLNSSVGSGGIRNTAGTGGTSGQGGMSPQGGTSGKGSGAACTAQAETCNGRDDDCNQSIDNEAGCPYPVVYFEKHAYFLVPMLLTWPDAAAYCRDRGYKLIVINDRKEEDWFTSQLSELRRNNGIALAPWWLGYTDAAQEGTWVASDGLPVGYTNWQPGKPNNRDKDGQPENCASLETNRDGGSWNDVGCTTTQIPFACEASDIR